MAAISVIIPTCNRGPMLNRAIDSVAGTENLLEIIVVDGASNDATPAVIAQWKQRLGEKLVVIREEKREGFTKAANRGFRAARGEFMTWINDDARAMPHALDLAMEQLAAAPPSVGLLAMFHHCQAAMSIAYSTVCNGREFKLMHVRGTLYANFPFGRRKTFEKLGFFDERYFARAADPDFSLKIWHSGLRVIPAFQSLIDHDETEDDRRAADADHAARDNQLLFAKWDLPPKNPTVNDFDPARPCTLRGLR